MQSNGKILFTSALYAIPQYSVRRLFSGLTVSTESPDGHPVQAATVRPSLVGAQSRLEVSFPHDGTISGRALLSHSQGMTQWLDLEDRGDALRLDITLPRHLTPGVYFLLIRDEQGNLARCSFIKI